MLWYKGWLETRFRVLSVLVIVLPTIGFVLRHIDPPVPVAAVESLLNALTFFLLLIPLMLAGPGIKTQRIPFGTTKGLQGSVYITLSLPVSRFRLLATRAGLGMLETVGVFAVASCVAWFMYPAPRADLTVSGLFAHWVTVSICMSSFYLLTVFLATFLGDQEEIGVSGILIVILHLLSKTVSVPPSLNIFRAMGAASPLFTHALPWASMAISLGAAAILFLAALKVVQSREY
jgi:hypothetical protein